MVDNDHDLMKTAFTAECNRLLDFGRGVVHPLGGAGWLDDTGEIDSTQPVFTWITARMIHTYVLGHLLGRAGNRELAEQLFTGLTGRLRDQVNGGWFTHITDEGETADEKACYTHAFVVLAASSATVAGIDGARELLVGALAIWEDKFFDAETEMFVDSWNRDFSTLNPYRGVNGNMHSVEALLAAADVLDDQSLRQRAFGIAQRVATEFAQPMLWRIPEHFDASWQPSIEHNRERPDDPFQPYGATVGHGLEWARLLLHVEASLESQAPVWLRPAAVALYERAVEDGWAGDGVEGFVYTTDWEGTPVVRDRMHWVLAEAIAVAACLHTRTGEQRFADDVATWWSYAESKLLDRDLGSWHHQLDEQNQPIATVWPGKPDLYHAVQAMLIPRLPLAPTLATALATESASVDLGSSTAIRDRGQ